MRALGNDTLPVFLGSESISFPDPRLADARGLVAVGGTLTVKSLLAAYQRGLFPWTANPVTWWSPDPRAAIELDHFHVPASLARAIRRQEFDITIDKAFRKVMEGCAEPTVKRGPSWITSEFIEAYSQLHKQGHAHSVECWRDRQLVGGIYGVAIGGMFAGESMFHKVSDASKVALYHLVQHLRQQQFLLLDIQTVSPVTRSLGAKQIPRRDFLIRLTEAIRENRQF